MWSRIRIEQEERTGRRLHVVGWTVAPDGGALVGGEVHAFPECPPESALVVESFRRAASPDVARAFPDVAAAAAARFEAVIDCGAPPPSGGQLVQLRPRFEQGFGRGALLGHELPRPPPAFVARVGGDADAGLEFVGLFLDAGLERASRVLDLGCGTGRMALPLSCFLSARGSYVGLDIDPELLDWCERAIAPRHPGFRFAALAASNGLYRSGRGPRADAVAFPLADASIDFAFATSLFTHLQPAETRRYLAELGRVLAPGGRLFATFFLFDEEARARSAAGAAAYPFQPHGAQAWVSDPAQPDLAVAFRPDDVARWAREAGLELATTLPGAWCRRGRPVTFQDSLIFLRSCT